MKKNLVLRPRLSEKVYALSEQTNTYVFDVSKSLNKHDVARAVKKQYEVGVEKVRLSNARAKKQRSLKKGGRSARYYLRSDIRKAYVSLKEGDKLPIFAAVEQSEKKNADRSKK